MPPIPDLDRANMPRSAFGVQSEFYDDVPEVK